MIASKLGREEIGMGGGEAGRPELRLNCPIPDLILRVNRKGAARGELHVGIPCLMERNRSRKRGSRCVPINCLGFSPPSWSFGMSSHF